MFVVLLVMALQAKTTHQETSTKFNTDSYLIGIDNRYTACISCNIDDFVGLLVKTNRAIKGFGGTRITNIYKGTLLQHWVDNKDMVHKFVIPNSFYVLSRNICLLSLQHWAREIYDIKPKEGTGCTTTSTKFQL